MRRGALGLIGASALLAATAVSLAACPNGGNGIGSSCNSNGDCSSPLQCVADTCVPLCQRAPECGEGYTCTAAGQCRVATGQAGDPCTGQAQCAAGLSCQLAGSATGSDGLLLASCVRDNTGARVLPDAAACGSDADCRDGTCALGRCMDLCASTLDCPEDQACKEVPRVEADGAMFRACIPAAGTMQFDIALSSPQETVLLPIPESAQSVSVVMSIDDATQLVAARRVVAPDSTEVFDDAGDPFLTPVRTFPNFGQSVLQMPSTPDTPLEPGAYQVEIASLRGPNVIGSATPHATVLVKLDTSATLDMHFYFLDLGDHPCSDALDVPALNAASAATSTDFQGYLDTIVSIFNGILQPGDITYEDAPGHPDLDGLDVSNAAALLSLGAHSTGINIFVVRSLSPAGIEVFGPNPGPATLAGTPQSGIVVGLDTLCYRTWEQLGQLTAHELARYMGLYNNVEVANPGETDPIADSDTSSDNLMFSSELGSGGQYFGRSLSGEQVQILSTSPVLR
jgi:hypothetical protein|nr:hypothetical protein [Kofleriaceae bacterium]